MISLLVFIVILLLIGGGVAGFAEGGASAVQGGFVRVFDQRGAGLDIAVDVINAIDEIELALDGHETVVAGNGGNREGFFHGGCVGVLSGV